MHNLKIQKAVTDLINLTSEEECLNIEYSMEALIEYLQYELKQEKNYMDYLANRDHLI